MKSGMSFTVLVGLAVALAACATRQIPLSRSHPVPADRIFSHEQVAGGARVVFVRDKGMMGGGCYLELSLDKQPVARIDKGERVAIELKPGTHVADARYVGAGLCSAGDSSRTSRATQIVVSANDQLTYRIAADTSGVVTITPRSE